ncbi:MAG: SIS domain-containing protein [Clostridia bacterium]|nr:SIS domain-containing protein [Clostridia bacterium]
MSGIDSYFDNLTEVLKTVRDTQFPAMEEAACLLCDTVAGGGNIFAFGCSHAGLLALELYYRTGGMALINPIKAPGLCLDVDPATFTSQIERLPEYGKLICDFNPIKAGDAVIVHSVSGRNTVTVDFALRCREKGAKVIALTSLEAGRKNPSRHPSGKLLKDTADIVLDNCGCAGDGSVMLEGLPEKVGPTSTAVGAAILNAIVVRTVEMLVQKGFTPPVFMSANVEGGDRHNAQMLAKYKDRIFYMGH